jgi:DUF3047 family protein
MVPRLQREIRMRRPFALVLVIALATAAVGPMLRQPAIGAEASCITLEDFANSRPGQFPAGWKPRKDEGKDVYAVQAEGGLRFLRALSKGLGIQAAKPVGNWKLGDHPILSWSWRPRVFPRGADERESGRNDSALAVYMLVQYSRVRGPKAVKYVWSERVPVGTVLSSNGGLTQVRVLRTGPPAARDAWIEERVNVLEDYKKLFKVSEAPKPAGIAVLTDADDTESAASGDYANFRACRG